MLDNLEITKLGNHETISSHLIRLGEYNILCDLPLNPDTILNLKKSTNGCFYQNEIDRINEEAKDESGEREKEKEINDDMSKKIFVDMSKIPLRIHFLLISNVESFVGLPIFCKYFDMSKTEIICTKPTFYFALCSINNLQNKEYYLPLWQQDIEGKQIKKSFDESHQFDFSTSLKQSIQLLSYKEKIAFKNMDDIIEVYCHSSGYSLGSCNFFIKTNFVNLFIINKSCYNVKRYPNPMDTSCLEKADVVLFTSYMKNPKKWVDPIETNQQAENTTIKKKKKNENSRKRESEKKLKKKRSYKQKEGYNAQLTKKMRKRMWEKIHTTIGFGYKDAINKLCSIVLKAIKKKGCVLIPMDLYFLYFIEIAELIGVIISKYLSVEEQVMIFTVMSNIHDVIYFAEACAEWVDDSRKQKCCRTKNPEHPFSFTLMKKNNRLCLGNNVHEIADLFKYPCVCFIQDSSLRLFESSDILKKWSDNENNTLILIDAMYDPLEVLLPFKILEMKIAIYYCPIWWQLNEDNILQIMHNNSSSKCTYILPHQLKSLYKKKNEEHQTQNLQSLNINKNKQPIRNDSSKISLKRNDIINLDSTNISAHEEEEEEEEKEEQEIATITAGKLKKNSVENLMKKHISSISTTGRVNISNQQLIENINWDNVKYIYPFKSINMIFSEFEKIDKQMKPIHFFCDPKNHLEKILHKVENMYFANVQCQLTSSFMGELLSAEDIHLAPNFCKTHSQNNSKKDKIRLLSGNIKPTDVKKSLVKKGYKEKDIQVNFLGKKKNLPWSIQIKSLDAEIKCYNIYDIEVFTSNATLRQHATEIIKDLSKII